MIAKGRQSTTAVSQFARLDRKHGNQARTYRRARACGERAEYAHLEEVPFQLYFYLLISITLNLA